MRRWIAALVSITAALAGCGGDDDPICDAADLQEALADAEAGDTVSVGACRVAGAFEVPAGVTLSGQGRGTSVIEGPQGKAAVTLYPGESATRLAALSIESDGSAGVLAQGNGVAEVDGVSIAARRGIGLGAEGLSSLTVHDVELRGPVTPATAPDLPANVSRTETATHGVVLVAVGQASLAAVSTRGFAGFGALLVGSATTWSTGDANDNVGTGLMVGGGTASLDGVTATGTLDGGGLIPAYGAVFSGDAIITTRGLDVSKSADYGLLQDGGQSTHEDLVASDDDQAGLWVQNATGFDLHGSGSAIERDGLAGIVLVDSSAVTVSDVHITGTTTRLRIEQGTGNEIEVGDGLHLIRPQGSATIQNVVLDGNARAGLLLDLTSGSPADVVFSGTEVNAAGASLGAIGQDASGVLAPGSGWDDGIVRGGAAAQNDGGVTDPLSAVGALDPGDMPSPELMGGLASLVGP